MLQLLLTQHTQYMRHRSKWDHPMMFAWCKHIPNGCKLQWSNGWMQVLEQVFKNETVGLATREEFLSKKHTLKDRLAEQEEQKKRQREAELAGNFGCRRTGEKFNALSHHQINTPKHAKSVAYSPPYCGRCSCPFGWDTHERGWRC